MNWFFLIKEDQPKMIRKKFRFDGSDDWRIMSVMYTMNTPYCCSSIQLVLTLDDDINDGDDLDSGDDDAGVYVKSMPGWPALQHTEDDNHDWSLSPATGTLLSLGQHKILQSLVRLAGCRVQAGSNMFWWHSQSVGMCLWRRYQIESSRLYIFCCRAVNYKWKTCPTVTPCLLQWRAIWPEVIKKKGTFCWEPIMISAGQRRPNNISYLIEASALLCSYEVYLLTSLSLVILLSSNQSNNTKITI